MNKIVLSLPFLVLCCTEVFAQPEIKGTPDEVAAFLKPDAKTVSVSGSAERTAFSDLAHVTVVVVTKEKTLGEAMAKNAAIRSSLTTDLTKSGVSIDRINNSHFSSSPQYGWFGSKPSTFEVVNRLRVTIASESELTYLSQKADGLEEVSIGNIRFEHSQKDKFIAEVNLAAIADAQTKAASYAKQLSIDLKPVSFVLSDSDTEPRYRSRQDSVLEEVIVTASKRGSSADFSESAPAPITFEEIRYDATATVVFEVQHQ